MGYILKSEPDEVLLNAIHDSRNYLPLSQIRRVLAGVRAANAVGYGLAASVVTNDLRRALTFVDRIEAGVVKVNEPTTGLALQAPFGGFKLSSANTFKEQGPAALEFYTRTKAVYVTYG